MQLIYKNIKKFEKLSFKEYRQKVDERQSFSFSFLNKERYGTLKPFEITANMKIGSQVDGILTDPMNVDFECFTYPIAKRVAYDIQLKFGDQIKKMQKQVSFFGEIEHKQFILNTNGRLDFLIPNFAVIDLKVTSSSAVNDLIKFMGYENQVNHYGNLAGVKKWYIMIHSIPLKQTFLFSGDVSNNSEFWSEKVLKFGTHLSELV